MMLLASDGDAESQALTDAQFGSIDEERLALSVHPIQVKARSFLYADRLCEVNVSSLHAV
jgi:hypothetical protein